MAEQHRNPAVDDLCDEIGAIVYKLRFKPNAVRLLTELHRVAKQLAGYKQDTGRW